MWGGSVKLRTSRASAGLAEGTTCYRDLTRASDHVLRQRRGTLGAVNDRDAMRVRRYDGGSAVGRGGHGEGARACARRGRGMQLRQRGRASPHRRRGGASAGDGGGV